MFGGKSIGAIGRRAQKRHRPLDKWKLGIEAEMALQVEEVFALDRTDLLHLVRPSLLGRP